MQMAFSVLSLLGVACANSTLADSIDNQMRAITGLLTSWGPGKDFGPLNYSFKNLEKSIGEYNTDNIKSKKMNYEEIHGITESLVDMMSEFGDRETDFENDKQKMTALKLFAPLTPVLETMYNMYANMTTNSNDTMTNDIFEDLEDLSDAFSQVDDAYGIPQPSLPKVAMHVKRSEELDPNYDIQIVDPVVVPPRVMYYVTTYYPAGEEPASVEPPELKDVEMVSMLEFVTHTVTGRRQNAAVVDPTGGSAAIAPSPTDSAEGVITETATAIPSLPTDSALTAIPSLPIDSVITETATAIPSLPVDSILSESAATSIPLPTDSVITETATVGPSVSNSALPTVSSDTTSYASWVHPIYSFSSSDTTSYASWVHPIYSFSSSDTTSYASWVHPIYSFSSSDGYFNTTNPVYPSSTATTASTSHSSAFNGTVKPTTHLPTVTISSDSEPTTVPILPTVSTTTTSSYHNGTTTNGPAPSVVPTQPTIAPKNAAARQYCSLLSVALAIGAIFMA